VQVAGHQVRSRIRARNKIEGASADRNKKVPEKTIQIEYVGINKDGKFKSTTPTRAATNKKNFKTCKLLYSSTWRI
jgi:hypothetical protein